MYYADWAFFTPRDSFMFYYYEDGPNSTIFVCNRPMLGMEKYFVQSAKTGQHAGIYDTKDITKYLLTKTWIMVDDARFFIKQESAMLDQQLTDKQAELVVRLATPFEDNLPKM
jgi:hypothetical protein